MGKTFQAFQSVKVIDSTLVRHDQVGVYVGMEGDEFKVKFEGDADGQQVIETFAGDSLEGM